MCSTVLVSFSRSIYRYGRRSTRSSPAPINPDYEMDVRSNSRRRSAKDLDDATVVIQDYYNLKISQGDINRCVSRLAIVNVLDEPRG